MLSTGGKPSVLVADTVGNASLNFLLKGALVHTAEAVLVHGSVVEDKEYSDPLSCYTNASDVLDCLRTVWQHQS